MVWTGSSQYRLAPALLTLLHQLEAAHPGTGWLNSPQTGTIGDSAHFAEGSSSDHNPWLDDTVRALDIAANVSGVAGIVAVADAPDCEALFAMVNRMYADRDPRVFPNGYAIYLRRITDWDNPGGYHAQQGDPHLYHLHISVSQNPAGFNSTALWPLPGAESTSSGTANQIGDTMSSTEYQQLSQQIAEIKSLLSPSARSAATLVHQDLAGTMARVLADQPEIIGLRAYLRGLTTALAGQSTTLPDGTKITSIGSAHAVEMSAINALAAKLDALSTPAVLEPVQSGPVLDEAKLAADITAAVRDLLGKLEATSTTKIGVSA